MSILLVALIATTLILVNAQGEAYVTQQLAEEFDQSQRWTVGAEEQRLEVFVCEESKLWERPSDEQQERRFARYRRYRNQAILESIWWVRDFIFYQGHESDRELEVYDLSGAWTAPDETRHCNDADWRRQIEEDRCLELWVFNHEVLTVVREANLYTVTVEPTGKGYQLVRFRRPEEDDAGSIRLVVVTPSGAQLETLTENAGTLPNGPR